MITKKDLLNIGFVDQSEVEGENSYRIQFEESLLNTHYLSGILSNGVFECIQLNDKKFSSTEEILSFINYIGWRIKK